MSHRIPCAGWTCVGEAQKKELDLYLGRASRRRGEPDGSPVIENRMIGMDKEIRDQIVVEKFFVMLV